MVGEVLDMPKGTVYGIAKGREPKDDTIRKKLGMEPYCPHCGKPPRRRKKPTRIRDMSKKKLLWALENRKEM